MTALRVLAACFGAGWLFAAATKVVDPEPAYEMIALLAGGGATALTGLGVAIAIEALLGGAMLAGLVRGFWASLALIGVLSAAAWWVSEDSGAWVPCGCLGGDGTVAEALTRNAWIAGVLVILGVLDLLLRRRARRS